MISKITKLLLHLILVGVGGGGSLGVRLHFFYSETASKIIS